MTIVKVSSLSQSGSLSRGGPLSTYAQDSYGFPVNVSPSNMTTGASHTLVTGSATESTITTGTSPNQLTYKVLKFTGSATLYFDQNTYVEYLSVAGGGGGGGVRGGGGGGGGMVTGVIPVIAAGTWAICSVQVGAGGAANSSGTDSAFWQQFDIGSGSVSYPNGTNPARGGGNGGADSLTVGDGGCGGGGDGPNWTSNPTIVTRSGGGTALQGFSGGRGNGNRAGGGGGGTSTVGGQGLSTTGGNGGVAANDNLSGTLTGYGGGGGGGGGTGGTGGTGGGAGGSTGAGGAGTVNTGGGGGGSRDAGGGQGGSGVVYIRYIKSRA